MLSRQPFRKDRKELRDWAHFRHTARLDSGTLLESFFDNSIFLQENDHFRYLSCVVPHWREWAVQNMRDISVHDLLTRPILLSGLQTTLLRRDMLMIDDTLNSLRLLYYTYPAWH